LAEKYPNNLLWLIPAEGDEVMKLHKPILYFVANIAANPVDHSVALLCEAAKGGISYIQLRDKSSDTTALIACFQAARHALAGFSIPLLLNDHVELAVKLGADGVHLGQEDMHPDTARALLGPDKIIGLSIEFMPELALANPLRSIDYIAASAVFPTMSKHDCKNFWGLDGLHQLVKESVHPVIAIGGIDQKNIGQVMATGVHGAAVVSAISDAEDACKATQLLKQEMRCTQN
jgi:thiamine-phosphate pyrophosphorylase